MNTFLIVLLGSFMGFTIASIQGLNNKIKTNLLLIKDLTEATTNNTKAILEHLKRHGVEVPNETR